MPPWSVFWRIWSALMPPAIPIATYRLQLTADFDFDAAAAIVPYLKALGITPSLCLAVHEGAQGQHPWL